MARSLFDTLKWVVLPFLSGGLFTHAQNAPFPNPQIWTPSGLIQTNQVSGSKAVIEERDGRIIEVEGPKHTLSIDYLDGVFWAWTVSKSVLPGNKKVFYQTLYRREGQTWQEVAKLESESGFIQRLYALRSGKFLATNGTSGWESGSKLYPWAIVRVNDRKEIVLDSVIDLGLKKSLLQKNSGKFAAITYNGLAFDMDTPTVLRTPNHVIFLSTRSCFFWIFDADTGHLERTSKLFEIEEDRLEKADYPFMMMGAQPRPDGDILFASRSEDALNQAHHGYPAKLDEAKLASDPEGERMRTMKDFDLQIQAFPRICWWSMDPSTGKIREEIPPRGFPYTIRDNKELASFNWRFKLDGNLLIYNSQESNERFNKGIEPNQKVDTQKKQSTAKDKP